MFSRGCFQEDAFKMNPALKSQNPGLLGRGPILAFISILSALAILPALSPLWPLQGFSSAALAQASQEDEPREKLKLGLLPIADTVLLRLALKRGYFAKSGLEVELIPFQSALEKEAAVQAGALDGHFCELSSVILQRASGLSFCLVSTTSHTWPGGRMFGLVTAPGSEISSLSQLSGKSLLTAGQTIVDFMTDIFLQREGLPLDYAKRREVRKIPIRVSLLLSGKADGAVLPEPFLSLVENAGGRVLADDRNLDMPLAHVALADSKAQPHVVLAMNSALAQAARAANEDPEGTLAFMLEQALVPPELAHGYRPPYFDLSLVPETLPSQKLFQAYLDYLSRRKFLSGPAPSFEETIRPGGIQASQGIRP
jgi:NitT/TauT family transport system substrate-binding protein